MSKITNDGLTRSGTGCFIPVPTHMATVGVRGLTAAVVAAGKWSCLGCVLCSDGLPSSALSSSGPGSAPPPSSTLDNFAPPPPQSSSVPQQPSAAAKLPYPNCGPPTSSQGPPQTLAPRHGHGGPPMMDGGPMAGFMPQQSQVFVFSTSMANQAAEAVERGLCRTIIDFHIDQPRTRQFLQVSLSALMESTHSLHFR